MADLYKVLGVQRNASDSEIKKAFHKQSLLYHPDKNSDKTGTELEEITNKFKAANEAYEILSDSEKRNQYDMGGMDAVNGRGGPGGDQGFQDMDNIFNMFFGGMPGMPGMPGMHFNPGAGGMGGPNIRVFHSNGGSGGFHQFFHHIEKPQTITVNIKITMQQSYNGIIMPITYESINVSNNIQSTEIKTAQVTIPAGVNNHENIILENKGHNINGEINGDVKVVVVIKNHAPFERNGMDLVYNKTLSLKEALCGFTFEFKHLNEKNICINNTSCVIKPDYKKVIPNLGFMRDGQIGNLVIVFSVNFPDTLSASQIEELNDIL